MRVASHSIRPGDCPDGKVGLLVVNTSHEDIILPSGFLIGDVHIAEEPLTPTQVSTTTQDEYIEAPPKPLTDREIKVILDKLNLDKDKFTKDEFNKIRELIQDVHAAFPADSGAPGFSTLPPMDIKTTGPPIKSKPYKYTPRDRKFLQETINRLLETGVISPSNSPWSSGSPVKQYPPPTSRSRSAVMRNSHSLTWR